jgi:hypothetical protein
MSAVADSTTLLWHGAGAVAPTSRAFRARHRLRTVVSEYPRLYLPLARRRYPGPSPRVVHAHTEAVIDGYTRVASTFAVYAFQLAQPRPVRLAHHLHAPAQLIEAARRGLPTIVLVREPKGAVLSQLVREPQVDMLDALFGYRRFHARLLPYREAFVVADFEEVIHDFGSVVERMNRKFGTSFGVFSGTPEELEECHAMMEQRPALSPVLLGFESGEVSRAQARAHLASVTGRVPGEADWVPSPERTAAKAALEGSWSSPRLATARAAAEDAYLRLRGNARC